MRASLLSGRSPMEHTRTLQKVPAAIKVHVNGMPTVIHILPPGLYQAVHSMVWQAAHKYGFISAFSDFEPEIGVYLNNDKKLIRKLYGVFKAERWDKAAYGKLLLRAVQGLPLFIDEGVKPGSLGHMISYGVKTFIILVRALQLPRAFIPNLFEPLGLAASSFGDSESSPANRFIT